MEKNVNELLLERDQIAKSLVNMLYDNRDSLGLGESYLYYSFPLYKEDDDSSTRVNVLLFSDNYGMVLFECAYINHKELSSVKNKINDLTDKIEQTFSQVYSRLIKSKLLRKSPFELNFPIMQVLFLNSQYDITLPAPRNGSYTHICTNLHDICEYFASIRLSIKIDEIVKQEALAVLEGSKGICKPQNRKITPSAKKTKGAIIQEVELSIHNFDRDQKRAALNIIDGPQRIRGLAGTGKTIILTWKAALIHLQILMLKSFIHFTQKVFMTLLKR